MSEEINTETQRMWKQWRTQIFITVWVTYLTYYLGRVNFAVARKSMELEYPTILDAGILGVIGTAFFLMYAGGQFVNGALGDKFGARKLVSFGLIVSAILNLFMGFSNGLVWMMILLWGMNGFFQAMGWAPSVKTVANWYPAEERGRWSSRLGTSYQVGGAASWILATFIIATLGLDWRFAFWVAGAIMLVSGVHMYLRVRNAPEEVGLPTIEEEEAGKDTISEARDDTHLGFEYTLRSIVTNRTVWFASIGLFFLNMVRYGVTEWLPYLIQSEITGTNLFGLWKTLAFPIGGIAGALVCAWISDKYLKKRRMPMISMLFFALTGALIIYTFLPPLDWLIGAPMLVVIGFLTFGPHVLLVSTIPMEFGTRKAASTATGFIDGWGYIGSAITTFGSGIIISEGESAFILWILMAAIGGLVLLFNWNSMPEKKEYY
ncbi:MAG: MFS transporter [Candidatus Hodarchaeales archaeon]|jgi:OPA family glycerol-3-phosphate transporter-like MFS transporter